MKLLKNAGFVRITFERRWSYRDDKFMWFEKNKGDFSYMKGTKDYYILEIRYREKLEEISQFLTDNGVKNEDEYGYLKVYY